MLSNYGALILIILAVLFGPIIAGVVWCFKQKDAISRAGGVLIIIITIVSMVIAVIQCMNA